MKEEKMKNFTASDMPNGKKKAADQVLPKAKKNVFTQRVEAVKSEPKVEIEEALELEDDNS